MKTGSSCVVVIPVHKDRPSQNELVSFMQCFNILGAQPIIVLAPRGLNMEAYKVVVPSFAIIYIDPIWQASLPGYNKLKVSLFFYELFKQYKWLLTYELDAFVFKDELDYWCNQDFDYIGAPWFEGYENPISTRITGVGNSGFSLRNVQTSRRLLKRIAFLKKLRSFWFKSRLQALVRFHKLLAISMNYFQIRSIEKINDLMFDKQVNEDAWWALHVATAFSDYRIAAVTDACRFSFDTQPSFLFKKNGNQLPFGCHAWARYEPLFWEPFVTAFNKYQKPVS